MKVTLNKGLTLAEALISLLFLSIVLVGGIGFYFNSSDVMTMKMHKKMAMATAIQGMEQMRDSGYSCLSYPAPEGCPPTSPTGTWEPATSVTFSNGSFSFTTQKQRRVTDVEGISPNINKRVEIQVSWTEPGKLTPGVINLATYMAP